MVKPCEATHFREDWRMKTVIALLFALVVVNQAWAQTARVTPAADITRTEIQAAFEKLPPYP
jgi:hypothetical protein